MDLKHLLAFTRQKLDQLNLNSRPDAHRKAQQQFELHQNFNNLLISKNVSEDPRYSNQHI